MADAHPKHEPHAPHAHAHPPYLKVFFALLVLTVMEYFYAKIASRMGLAFSLLVLGLMVMAIVKATLVAMYFMHLKFEGRWVYLMLIPAGILATVLVTALYPDIGMQPGPVEDAEEDEDVASAPLEPGRAGLPSALG